MEDQEYRRLKNTIFNFSKSITHVHVYGENCSGRSEVIRKILKTDTKNEWVCATSDFLYADGSLKLLLGALAADLNFKTKGDKIEDFVCNAYEFVDWPDPKNKKIIIFLDNAQAVVNYPPAVVRCLLNSTKTISSMIVRFVTSAPSPWESSQTNISLGHLPIVQLMIKTPDSEKTISLIQACNQSINPQFIKFGVDLLAHHCKAPNTLLAIISQAYHYYGEHEKIDLNRAGECLQNSAKRLGLANSFKSSSNAVEMIQSFESMPVSMKYLLISAYCASNNSTNSDRRFFVKHHGKEKRSEMKELRAEVNRLMKDIEPKTAELGRIVCIYETLVRMHNEEPFNGFDIKNVISSLVSMGLVTTTNMNNLDMPKIKCLISLESALKIAGSLEMPLRDFLEVTN